VEARADAHDVRDRVRRAGLVEMDAIRRPCPCAFASASNRRRKITSARIADRGVELAAGDHASDRLPVAAVVVHVVVAIVVVDVTAAAAALVLDGDVDLGPRRRPLA
jgi:hypothetical protein